MLTSLSARAALPYPYTTILLIDLGDLVALAMYQSIIIVLISVRDSDILLKSSHRFVPVLTPLDSPEGRAGRRGRQSIGAYSRIFGWPVDQLQRFDKYDQICSSRICMTESSLAIESLIVAPTSGFSIGLSSGTTSCHGPGVSRS